MQLRDRMRALLDRIDRIDGEINAYVAVDEASVMREAERLDALAPEARGPLHGLTLAVKDLIDVAGYATRAGSAFFERHPTRDAPVVQKLRAAGAIVVGKTNTHEFAWGVTTENPHFGRTCNPWNLERIVGGSSGGSGAAIAAGLADLALGSDTLGSIRTPAALCGISGIRPATGAITIEGIVPLAPTLDTVGPMAYDVETVAAAYRVLAPFAERRLPLRVGRLRGGEWESLQPELARALDAVREAARTFGIPIEIDDVEWFDPGLAAAASSVQQGSVSAAGFHTPLFAKHSAAYGDDVRARVALALEIGPKTVADARAHIADARTRFDVQAAAYDLVIAPVSTGEAPRAPAPASFRTELMHFVAPASAFGIPALALPIGFSSEGLPLGMQVMARDLQAASALAFGAAFQQVTDWHRRRPAAFDALLPLASKST
ncbi:MAG: amidase [Candidatus Velthaea sp.]